MPAPLKHKFWDGVLHVTDMDLHYIVIAYNSRTESLILSEISTGTQKLKLYIIRDENQSTSIQQGYLIIHEKIFVI